MLWKPPDAYLNIEKYCMIKTVLTYLFKIQAGLWNSGSRIRLVAQKHRFVRKGSEVVE